jgi:uncharacterized protein YndB with AHSA1/START domain
MTGGEGAGEHSGEVLVVRRVLPVERERVFAAWLDPASLATWMRPGETTRTLVELDPRVGGRFRIVMEREQGGCGYEHRGEYLAIEPPSLLSFTWISAATDLRPTVVTVELHERSGGTELVLTHQRLPAERVDGHRQGWTDIVRLLETELVAGH